MNEPTNFVPVLSEGIEFNKLSEKDFILSNTEHRHYVKINTDVHNLLNLIDGNRNIDEISQLYKKIYHKEISSSFIYKLLNEKLVQFGILKGFDERIKPYKKPPYLKLSFQIFNEKFVQKIVPYFYFLFNKKYAIVIIILSLIFISTVFYQKLDIYKSFNTNSCLAFYILMMALSVTFHEVGHATAASLFGAKPGAIGGGFYLLRPVYYTDVTDVWRLKKKHRVIVNLSGIYFEMIFCSVSLFIGLIIDNYILIVVTLLIAFSTLFNLNPLMRTDGFWVVSDLINKPNLFQHAAKKIKEIIKWILFRKPIKWHIYDIILIVYGIISYFFMGMFIYIVLFKNPASILYLPQSLFDFFKRIIAGQSFSLGELMFIIMPIFFYIMLFNLIKKYIMILYNKYIKKVSDNL